MLHLSTFWIQMDRWFCGDTIGRLVGLDELVIEANLIIGFAGHKFKCSVDAIKRVFDWMVLLLIVNALARLLGEES